MDDETSKMSSALYYDVVMTIVCILTLHVQLSLVAGDNHPEAKKLSCRRETAQRFVSLNIFLSHSRSLKVIRNGTVE